MSSVVYPAAQTVCRPAWRMPAGQPDSWPSIDEICRSIGLAPAIALDCGDRFSDPQSGQTIRDLSGNGRDFILGATTSVSTDDPSPEGLTGSRSPQTVRAHDGGDYCVKATANDTFVESCHKDSALFTAYMFAKDIGSSGAGLMATRPSQSVTSQTGWLLNITGTTNVLRFSVANGSGTALAIDTSSTIAVDATGWVGLGVSINEATGAGLFFNGGETEDFDCTYNNPASGAATGKMSIGARTGGGTPLPSGAKLLVPCLMFPTALTDAQFKALNTLVRSRAL